ncbi:MAG: hypothetical protein PWQ14_1077 [Rikenellaceae bacterium]|nr:hypothetical protein [Rikenellaceae bacterium]
MKKLNVVAKKVALLMFISLFSIAAYSQFYINVGGGYNLGIATQSLLFNYEGTNDIEKIENVKVSLGKGLNFGLNLGYMFNGNIGIDLQCSYLLGDETSGESKDNFTYFNINYYDYEKESIKSQMFRVNPSIIIASGFDKLDPYAKFGVILGFGSITYNRLYEEYENNQIQDIKVEKWKYDGGMAFGISSALGLMYHISDLISVYGELDLVGMSYAPKKGVMTEYTINGADQLPELTTDDKEIDFVDDITYDYDNPPSSAEPSKELKFYFPYSSIGLNIGVRFSF